MTVRPRRIYLDHNATAPLLPQAKAAMIHAFDLLGNPSSVHEEGRRARAAIEAARGAVANLVGAVSEGVVFTSGATEAANTCLVPEWTLDGASVAVKRLAVADADHPATREGGRFAAEAVTRLPVDRQGLLGLKALDAWLEDGVGRGWSMLCLTLANGETGVVQDIVPIVDRLIGRDVIFVLDVSQAAGRMPLSISDLRADALLVSGHKIGAAKGIGALVLADEARRPRPLLLGGGHEKGRRAGTEALAEIVSFGIAAGVAAERAPQAAAMLGPLRHRLAEGLAASGASFRIVGEGAARLPNTLTIAAEGLRGETVQIALDLAGFAVSSGSACSSGKVGASHVLKAMVDGGFDIDPSLGAIRVSFGYETTVDEIDAIVVAMSRVLRTSRQTSLGRHAA
ncbi:MAG: cysteine desulfurase [Rhizobiaceae bacterium]|nr:cysteine desulfurase [Rhizobiaceae bacterium]